MLTEPEMEARREIVRRLVAAGILLSEKAIQHLFDPDCVLVFTGFAVHQGDGVGGYIGPLLSASAPRCTSPCTFRSSSPALGSSRRTWT
jgi:hypothetical protein